MDREPDSEVEGDKLPLTDQMPDAGAPVAHPPLPKLITDPLPQPLPAPNSLPVIPKPSTAQTTANLTPAQARANASAKRMFSRLVHGEAPPTAPMNIVDRLAGSPYANPMIQVGAAEKSARKTIDFALRMAETMFRYGAGALEVETSIIAVTAAFGLRNIEVDITNQSVIINYAIKDGVPITVLRVVRSWTSNYAGLVAVHELVTDIVSNGVSQNQAIKRLDTIIRQPKPFPRWMVSIAEPVFAAAVVGVIGGSWIGMAVAVVTIFLAGQVARVLGKWRVPDFFVTAISTFIVTLVAVFLFMLEVPLSPSIVVAGGILLLLPSGRLVSAVQDAINGFPVTAAGRFLSAFLSFGAIVSGIAVAFVVTALFGGSRLNVTEKLGVGPPLWLVLPLVAIATVTICIFEQTAVRLIVPTTFVALAGYLVYHFGTVIGLGDRFAPALAAIVVGILARLVSLRMRAPQLVVAVPSIIFLLVGLSIFRAMYVLTITPDDSVTGAVGIFNALVVILAVAAGVVLGDNIARPLTRGQQDRRRNRRR